MGGPTCVSKTNGALGVGWGSLAVKAIYLADSLAQLYVSLSVNDGYSGAIITPVL